MQTQKNKNLKNTISILLIGTKIALVIIYLMVAVCFIGLIFGIVINKDFLVFNIEDIGGMLQTRISDSVQVSFPLTGGTVSIKSIAWSGGLLGFVYSLFLMTVLTKFKSILNELKNDRPFGEKSYLSLRMISYLFMGATVVIPIFEFIFFSQLILPITSPQIDLTFGLNLNYLYVGLILYVLAKVFEYGAFLQTSYDETV